VWWASFPHLLSVFLEQRVAPPLADCRSSAPMEIGVL
jgi:hypothetical protein